jgi:hypothetical protein
MSKKKGTFELRHFSLNKIPEAETLTRLTTPLHQLYDHSSRTHYCASKSKNLMRPRSKNYGMKLTEFIDLGL